MRLPMSGKQRHFAIFTRRESAAGDLPRPLPSPAWPLPPCPFRPCARLPCAGVLLLPFAWLRICRYSRHAPLHQPAVPVPVAANVFHDPPPSSRRHLPFPCVRDLQLRLTVSQLQRSLLASASSG